MKLPDLPARFLSAAHRIRGKVFHTVAAALLACAALLPSLVSAEIIDRIAATVNNEIITESELRCSAALAPLLESSPETPPLTDLLDGLLARRLLVQEARRLKLVEVSDTELNAALEKIKGRFSSETAFNGFLAELDLAPRELSRMLEERIVAERFVEQKVGLFVRVSREEAQSYFDEHAEEFENKRFQDVQKTVHSLLLQRKLRSQLDQFLAELRGRADIRTSLR